MFTSYSSITFTQSGSKGNLTERTFPMMGSIGLLVPAAVLLVYFLIWQSYVLRIDIIITGIFLGVQAFEIMLSVISMVVFAR